MNKSAVYALFALAAVIMLGACDKQSFDETRQLQPGHGHSDDHGASDHADKAKDSHGAKPADIHGEKKADH